MRLLGKLPAKWPAIRTSTLTKGKGAATTYESVLTVTLRRTPRIRDEVCTAPYCPYLLTDKSISREL